MVTINQPLKKYLFEVEKERICVMFSGGYDSTLLLIKALEMKRDGIVEEVYVTYIDCENIPNYDHQKEAMNSILLKLESKICECKINNVKLDLNSMNFYPRIQSGQLLMFLPICLLGIPDNTEIWFGMIEHTTISDTVSKFAREKAMNNIVTEISNHFSNLKDVVVKCPIMRFGDDVEARKTFVIDKLLDYKDILDLCFSCEDMHSKNNYDCSCTKHRELLTALLNVYEMYCYPYLEYKEGKDFSNAEDIILKMRKIKEIIKNKFPRYYSVLSNLVMEERLKIK